MVLAAMCIYNFMPTNFPGAQFRGLALTLPVFKEMLYVNGKLRDFRTAFGKVSQTDCHWLC